MRKLLLLTNCFVLCEFLSSCQTPTKKSSEIEVKTSTKFVAKDSVANSKVVIQNDTTKSNTSTHSDKHTTTVNPTNSNNKQTTKAKPTERIEHGSNNQAKLDSIKKAKGKLKK